MANQNPVQEETTWLPVVDVAVRLRVRPRLVYLWLEKPQEETKIRRRYNDDRKLEIHFESAKKYADERPRPGRPRKQ